MMNSLLHPFSWIRAGAKPATGLILAVLPLALVLAAPGVSAQTDRMEMAKEITDLLRLDRRTEALSVCRSFTELFPDDPVVLYNLACLENTAGNPDNAVEAFSRAVAAGFDDFTMAFRDPDLASLKYHPDMIDLSLKHQLRLAELAAGQAVDLTWQTPSPSIPLVAAYSADTTGAPEIFLTWTPVGLQIELHAGEPWDGLADPENLAPWNGGPGLVITLGIPAAGDPDHYQTSNHFLFAFGLEKSTPLGAAFLSGQQRWQSVMEMQPKIRLDSDLNLELQATIPWALILPYNPLVDDRLGFNAALRLTGPEASALVGLLPDPAAFRPRTVERRVVPLVFRSDSVGEEVFVGKMSNTISSQEPLTFDLVAVSPGAGKGRLTIDFLGGPQQSLLPDGQVSGTLDLTPGLNRLTRQADFTALETGPYLLKAEMAFPSGRSLSWGTTILHLASGWREDYLERIEALPPQEKPTALFHLQSIEQAAANHNPRRGPESIATTLTDLDRLLTDASKNGTILPDRGTFLAVFPGPDGQTRLCHCYFPAGWKIADRLNPVLTLTAATGMAGAIANRMGQIYEKGRQKPTLKTKEEIGFPIYLVPRLGPLDSRRPGDLAAETAACLTWVQNTFATDEVSIAGVDQGAGTSLELAVERPQSVKAMILFAGANLEPWPQADFDFVKQQLAGFPRGLPITWTDFIRETEMAGQGPLILDVLRDLGNNIVEVQEVRGGLNFTQAADRTVLWAEGLR